MPVLQLPAPDVGAQTVPHVPQSVLVTSGVSHPFEVSPSQSPQLRVQSATAQVPVSHVAVAFGGAQVEVHVPQWVVVLRAVSQPLAALPSQSPQPVSHAPMPQVP